MHTFSGDGGWVAFTYEDHVLAQRNDADVDLNQRNVGVSVPVDSVTVPATHPRNHDGEFFSVLVTQTSNRPTPGSDQISRAFSDAWIGRNGYVREDGTRQQRAIAFQGHVQTRQGNTIAEVFVVDIPDDVTQPGPTGPLAGTSTRRPQPPSGTRQRRLTSTADRKFPGIQGVRHWLRSSPDGSLIAFLMKDNAGISQLWTISPQGGPARQLTHNQHPVSSAFSWSHDGSFIAHTMHGSVCITAVETGVTQALTTPNPDAPLRPEACVFSPNGAKIAYVRQVTSQQQTWNQVFVVSVPAMLSTTER